MRRARGFTLVEAALVLVILGLALAVAVPLLTSYTKMTRARATRDNLRSLRESLLGYLLARGRLPAADADGDGLEDPGAFTGTVPWRTLGVPRAQARDALGVAIRYDVAGAPGANGKLTDTTPRNVRHQLQAFIAGTSPSAPRVIADGEPIGVAFVLLSPGADRGYEEENADDDRDYARAGDDQLGWATFQELYAALQGGRERYRVYNANPVPIYVRGGPYPSCTPVPPGSYCEVGLGEALSAYASPDACQQDLSPTPITYQACRTLDFAESPPGDRDAEVQLQGLTLSDR